MEKSETEIQKAKEYTMSDWLDDCAELEGLGYYDAGGNWVWTGAEDNEK